MVVTVTMEREARTVDNVKYIRHMDGALLLMKTSGTIVAFAPGRWIAYEAIGAAPGTLTAADHPMVGRGIDVAF